MNEEMFLFEDSEWRENSRMCSGIDLSVKGNILSFLYLAADEKWYRFNLNVKNAELGNNGFYDTAYIPVKGHAPKGLVSLDFIEYVVLHFTTLEKSQVIVKTKDGRTVNASKCYRISFNLNNDFNNYNVFFKDGTDKNLSKIYLDPHTRKIFGTVVQTKPKTVNKPEKEQQPGKVSVAPKTDNEPEGGQQFVQVSVTPGTTKEDIKLVQRFLRYKNLYNYGLNRPDEGIDGIWGSNSKAAASAYMAVHAEIKDFQGLLDVAKKTRDIVLNSTGTVPGATTTQDTGTVPGATTTQDTGTVPGATTTQDTGTVPGETTTQDTGTAPGETTTQDTGTAPGETVSQNTATRRDIRKNGRANRQMARKNGRATRRTIRNGNTDNLAEQKSIVKHMHDSESTFTNYVVESSSRMKNLIERMGVL